MKWMLSGSLITLTIVGGSLLVPKPIVPASRPIAVRMGVAQLNTTVDEKLLVGSYCLAALFGDQELELKPNHRFCYRMNGCVGVLKEDHGTWELQGDILVLHPELKSTQSLNVRLIPITWKNRLYLIDKNKMPAFSHSCLINDPSGIWGNFDKELPKGSKIHFPTPPRFRHFLEQGAVTARVASVDNEKVVTLEGADVSRLQPGMHLCWKEGNLSGKCELRIIEIGPEFARASQVPIISPYDSQVRPGELFTTGAGRFTPVGTGVIDH